MKPVYPLVCLLLLGTIVSAESLQRRSPVEQALSADAVGTAQLLFKRGIELDGIVHTKFLFKTAKSLRGKLPVHFEVFSPGGILGHRALRDSRMPDLELGRDYLLYLKQRKGKLWFYNGSGGARPVEAVPPIFLAKIKSLEGGRDLSRYLVEPRITMASTSDSGLIETSGVPMRYTEPDQGVRIPVYADVSTLPNGISEDDAISALENSIKVWEDNSSYQFKYMGTEVFTQSAESYAHTGSGIIRVQFHDNWNIVADGSDTLAIGGSAFLAYTTAGYGGTVSNVPFHPATHGYVIVNHPKTHLNTPSTLEEVICHELGHVLGLAHSSEDPDETDAEKLGSVMYYLNKGDGSGATLNSHDVTTIQKAYPLNPPPYSFERSITAVTVPSSTGNLVNFSVNQAYVGGHDLDGDSLTVQILSNAASNGTFTLSGTTLTYTPAGYFSDTLVSDPATQSYDAFYYRIFDGVHYSPIFKVGVIGFLSDSKPDNAQDGLPDSWMTTHFGSIEGSTDSSDPDGDGQSNLCEFLQGTDPNDEDSSFRILNFDGTTLEWTSQQFGLYILESSTDFETWTTYRIYGQSTGTASSMSIDSPPGPTVGNVLVYRLTRSP